MKAKEYLSQALWLDQLIENKIRYQEKLRTLAERATVDISCEKVSGGNINSRENTLVKLIDISHEVNADIDKLVGIQKEIMDTIDQLEDGRLKLILEMRYVNRADWDAISQELNCDQRWIMRLHKKALDEIDVILKIRHLKP